MDACARSQVCGSAQNFTGSLLGLCLDSDFFLENRWVTFNETLSQAR
jgi:hypothetical protein